MSLLERGDWSGITIASPYSISITAEELYQAFKERLMSEMRGSKDRLTLAGLAMQGLLANHQLLASHERYGNPFGITSYAVEFADAVIAELEKQK